MNQLLTEHKQNSTRSKEETTNQCASNGTAHPTSNTISNSNSNGGLGVAEAKDRMFAGGFKAIPEDRARVGSDMSEEENGQPNYLHDSHSVLSSGSILEHSGNGLTNAGNLSSGSGSGSGMEVKDTSDFSSNVYGWTTNNGAIAQHIKHTTYISMDDETSSVYCVGGNTTIGTAPRVRRYSQQKMASRAGTYHNLTGMIIAEEDSESSVSFRTKGPAPGITVFHSGSSNFE